MLSGQEVVDTLGSQRLVRQMMQAVDCSAHLSRAASEQPPLASGTNLGYWHDVISVWS